MIVALSNAASAAVLLAVPLTAVLVLKVAENARRDPGAVRSTRALEGLALVLAVGMKWMSVFMPLALLCLLAVFFAPRVPAEGRSIRISDRLVGWIVYVWAAFAIAGAFRLAFEATASR